MRILIPALSIFALAACNQPAAAPHAQSADTAKADQTAPVVSPVSETPADKAGLTNPAEGGTTDNAPGNFTAWGDGFRAVVKGDSVDVEIGDAAPQTIKVEKSAFAKGVDFTGPDGMEMTIKGGECKDDSGTHDMTANLKFKGKTYKGCAGTGASGHAPT